MKQIFTRDEKCTGILPQQSPRPAVGIAKSLSRMVYPKVLVMDYMAGESLNCLLTRKNQDIVYDNQSVKAVKNKWGRY